MHSTLDLVVENKHLSSWINNFKRHPLQENLPHTSDSELICIENGSSMLLAISAIGDGSRMSHVGRARSLIMGGWSPTSISLHQ